MPETSFDQELAQLLQYDDTETSETFVVEVMQSIRREQRTRKVILWVFGLIGALFGLAGAMMLSDNITSLFTFTVAMPAEETMQVVLFIVAATAFYTWFMNDDLSLDN